jgi:hypothetical protein
MPTRYIAATLRWMAVEVIVLLTAKRGEAGGDNHLCTVQTPGSDHLGFGQCLGGIIGKA